jgi:hypothetical protein
LLRVWKPRTYAAVLRANWVRALVLLNSARGVPDTSSRPPVKLSNQMKGKGVPEAGMMPVPPWYVLPEDTFSQGAGDQIEPMSLKSPSWPFLASPFWAITPAARGSTLS